MNIELCIALVPEHALSLRLSEVSHSMATLNGAGNTILQLQGNIGRLAIAPHMTLYQVRTTVASLDSAACQVAEVLKMRPAGGAQIGPLHMQAMEISSNDVEGSTEVKYKTTPEILKLQDMVVKIFNPLRGGMTLERNPAGLTHAEAVAAATSGPHLASLEEFGFPEVGPDTFNPHVTVSWRKCEVEMAVGSIPENTGAFSGAFTQLAIFCMGPQGTTPQRLVAFDL